MKSYSGPYYDIVQVVSPAAARSDKAVRQKLYVFDSNTQLLNRATYQIQRAGQNIKVETVYSGWTVSGGQALPGQIGTENGANVFTIAVKSGQTSAVATDSLFSHP